MALAVCYRVWPDVLGVCESSVWLAEREESVLLDQNFWPQKVQIGEFEAKWRAQTRDQPKISLEKELKEELAS